MLDNSAVAVAAQSWESADAVAAFGEQRIAPAFAQAGVLDDVLAGPQPVAYETFEIVRKDRCQPWDHCSGS